MIGVISELVTQDTIQKFSSIIRYNLETYFDLYSFFIQNHQPNITRYFQEQDTPPVSDSFDFLEKMIVESNKIDNLIKSHGARFSTFDSWELLDFIEEIKTSLLTINNTSKYTRSSKTKNSWRSSGIMTTHTIAQNETLENIVESELQSQNSQDDWTSIAISNNLLETDYDTEGGALINIQKGNSFAKNLFLESVVDNLVGTNLYGKDLNKKITFIDDDLEVLEPEQTIFQAVNILIKLQQGEIPEFPKLGRDPKICVGSNINVFEYGLLVRQLNGAFSSDDTIRRFTIQSFKYDNGDMYVTYEFDTFFNITKSQTAKI